MRSAPLLHRLLPTACAAMLFFAAAQTEGGGRARVGTYRSTVDGAEQEYALYLPRVLDPSRKYPLIVGLHEEESNHIAELKHIFALPVRYGESTLATQLTLPTLPEVDFIVACPFARGTMGYQGVAEQDVYDLVAEMKRRYPIDEDRVYLTGSSMGGGGALWMALTRPDVWAAVAPVSAAIIPGTEDFTPNALNLPIRLFHGDQDPAVPVASSRQWHRRLLDAGAPVDYVEYPGVRHNAWDFAYRAQGIFHWFADKRRNASPDHVRFSTDSYRYNRAYWLHVEGLTPGVVASIDAVRSGTDLRVVTQNVDAFSVSAAAKTVTVDGAPIRLRAGAPLGFVKTAGKWTQAAYKPQGKRPGREGPIVDALRGRHIWVYGTGGAPNEEELARRKSLAEAGAMWSTSRVRLNLPIVIKGDGEVTEDEIANANLILFGTRETNSLIARFERDLPMSLSPAAADWGMVYVAPIGGRYVVVNSGLPWWTGAEQANRGGYRFAPEQYRLLSTFGDYLVFKGGLRNVVVEGRFDNGWRLMPDARERLRGAGVVTVR